MYAIVETGGKQYRVENGVLVQVERLSGDVGRHRGTERRTAGSWRQWPRRRTTAGQRRQGHGGNRRSGPDSFDHGFQEATA